jgi:hypothetical protein
MSNSQFKNFVIKGSHTATSSEALKNIQSDKIARIVFGCRVAGIQNGARKMDTAVWTAIHAGWN